MSEEAVEKERSNSGHADKAGVGESEGEGEDSLVFVGDVEIVFSRTRGLKAIFSSKPKVGNALAASLFHTLVKPRADILETPEHYNGSA